MGKRSDRIVKRAIEGMEGDSSRYEKRDVDEKYVFAQRDIRGRAGVEKRRK